MLSLKPCSILIADFGSNYSITDICHISYVLLLRRCQSSCFVVMFSTDIKMSRCHAHFVIKCIAGACPDCFFHLSDLMLAWDNSLSFVQTVSSVCVQQFSLRASLRVCLQMGLQWKSTASIGSVQTYRWKCLIYKRSRLCPGGCSDKNDFIICKRI